MFKIHQAKLQQFVNQELPEVQAGFLRGSGEIKLPTFIGLWRKQEVPEIHLLLHCSYTKAFDYWFQVGKGVCQGCILSPCLFNL